MMETLNLCSLNANGLNSPVKRRAIFKMIRDGMYDIALLQETHCTSEDEHLWKAEWGGAAFFSNGRSNARGVITLFKRGSPCEVTSQTRDLEGRFLSLTMEKDGETFTIANIDAPTQDRTEAQIDLIDRLEDATSDCLAPNIIIAGDLNLCMDPALDKNSTSCQAGNMRYKDRIVSLSDTLFLTDVWRWLHPSTKQFSFHRANYNSRLDYWLASDHLLGPDVFSDILRTPLSDHALITLKIGPKPQTWGPGMWKFDNSLLQNTDYSELIHSLIEDSQDEVASMNPNSRWEWTKFKCKEETIRFSKNRQAARKQHKSELRERLKELSWDRFTGGGLERGLK